MRRLLLRALPLALCLAAFGGETQLLQIGELPGEKTPDLLRAKERNPFTRRETKTTDLKVDRESEESLLRDLFKTMPITGVIRGGGSVKVLLANLILKEGQTLPPMLEDQTEHLIVTHITDRQVEIAFIENEEQTEPRKILIPIDLRPHVAISMPPVVAGPKGPSSGLVPIKSGAPASSGMQ